MIPALIHRRIWLWKNRLLPSAFLFFMLPVFIFSMISLPLKNIIRFSLAGIPYDIWVFPGMIFIISSLSMFPIIYREFFELRIHGKVLINIALTPHSKRSIIFSYLVTAGLEAFVMIIFSMIVYASFIQITFNVPSIIFLIFCLAIYNLLLGNLYITMSLIIDTLTTMLLGTFMLFLLVLFGNGFLIEFSFFPLGLESLLEWSPLAIPFQIYQKFHSTGLIDYVSITIIIGLIYLWILLNSHILKQKLRQ